MGPIQSGRASTVARTDRRSALIDHIVFDHLSDENGSTSGVEI